MDVAGRKRLTPQDWAAAALAAMADGGIAAVAVEPLASRLGTTKGSFYWHFGDRDALIGAALDLWERLGTEEIIAVVDAESDPRTRLRTLLTVALGADRPGIGVELALQASVSHPRVAAALARVTERRIGYLAGLFAEIGFAPEQARMRSILAYSAYLGHAQLAHATPGSAPAGAELAAYVEAGVAALVAPAAGPDPVAAAGPARAATGDGGVVTT